MTISAEPLQNLLVMRSCRTRRAQCVSLQDLRREEAETLLIFANKQTSEAFFFWTETYLDSVVAFAEDLGRAE